MAFKKVFGKGFRALKLSCTFAGAKNRQITSLKKIHNAIYQRLLRPYDSKANPIGGSKVCQPLKVIYPEVNILDIGFPGSARIAGSNKYFFYICALGSLPCKSVLAPTRANNQYIHQTHSNCQIEPRL